MHLQRLGTRLGARRESTRWGLPASAQMRSEVRFEVGGQGSATGARKPVSVCPPIEP